ncbi:MAG TPA: alpha/beta fold hydrolase [Chitinophagaceae bacterium]|nr:alpha/beta fold hydrolase [Chitinophagaceae bacterium]
MEKLLLLHGALGAASQFELWKPVLEKQFEVHVLDFYGHGLNNESKPWGIASFSDQLIQYIREQNGKPVWVLGYSMGGYVALHAALQSPELFAGIMTLATKWDWTPEQSAREASMLDAETMKAKSPGFIQLLKERHWHTPWEFVLSKTAALMLELGKNPALKADEMNAMQIPVYITVGDRDAMVSMEESRDLYRLIPGAQFGVLPLTPHLMEKMNIDMVSAQLISFTERTQKLRS